VYVMVCIAVVDRLVTAKSLTIHVTTT